MDKLDVDADICMPSSLWPVEAVLDGVAVVGVLELSGDDGM